MDSFNIPMSDLQRLVSYSIQHPIRFTDENRPYVYSSKTTIQVSVPSDGDGFVVTLTRATHRQTEMSNCVIHVRWGWMKGGHLRLQRAE